MYVQKDLQQGMKKTFLILCSAMTINAFAQSIDLGEGISYAVEMSGTISGGEYAPFWLTANRYGVPSIERNSGHIRGGIFRNIENDSTRRWGLGYGADFVATANHTSTCFVQQLYADVRWLRGTLTVGQKQQPMQLKNNELSSGSQTLGINARPYPEVRLALPDYWKIPGTKGFLSFKGHIAYGTYTDNHFQKDFAKGYSSYDQNVLMHTKAGYLKFGKDGKPFSVEAGAEMAAQFGSTHYNFYKGNYTKQQNGRGLSSFWHAFVGGGSDSMDGEKANNEGNMLGSLLLRLNYDAKDATFGLYADHFFEDQSALFMLDYDGYAYENGQMVKKDKRFLLYPLKDIMLGADVHFKKTRWITDAVIEYIYTKYQSGPVYVDRTPNIPDHIGGVDNYYNNSIEPGWQHWGQALGNPFYISPVYNSDHNLMFECNRFVAWHIGIAGQPTEDLHYRLKASWQEGIGTYDQPYFDPKQNVSISAEAIYNLHKLYKGLSVTAALGIDRGTLIGNNAGGCLTLRLER